jgi:Uma2 family endonuclease
MNPVTVWTAPIPEGTILLPGGARPHLIVYPESDGEPLAENTKQLRWIMVLCGNLAALFHDRPDVFVGGDLFWYPVEGHPDLRYAPDVLVVFGRPKGDRRSYLQWLEDHVPLTVVFEILSPKNTVLEMVDKLAFYDEHGVEEYYVYDPETNRLVVYLRRGEVLLRQRRVDGFVSPRLGIRFDLSGPEMTVYGPDNQRFLTFEELSAERLREQNLRRQAEQQADQARQQADQARQQADQAKQRTARLAELGRKARQGRATAEELAELDRLEQEASV